MKLFRKLGNRSPAWLARVLFNCWPPFVGAGIHILTVSPDYRAVRVRLKRSWYNKNYVGTQFGGSIYAMTDPFYMWTIMTNLGHDYIVWDKAGEIEFVKPGRSTVHAQFRLDDATLAEMTAAAAGGDKVLRWFETDVIDRDGEVVARVRKQLYLRRKPAR